MATRKSTARKLASTKARATPQDQSDSPIKSAATRAVPLDTIDLLMATISKVRRIVHACQQTDLYGAGTQRDAIGDALWAALDLLDDARTALQEGTDR